MKRRPARADRVKELVLRVLHTRRVRAFLIVSVSVVAVDQLAKWVIRSTMHLNQTIEVLGEFFTLSFILNSGIAFGMFDSHPSPYKTPLLIFVSLVALGIILYIFLSLPRNVRLAGVSMGLVFGGAIGNIIDRMARGEVVDFLDVDFPDIVIPALNIHMTRWPTFNIADSCVLVGIVMLLVIIIRHGARSEEGEDAEQETAA